uniref:Aa_trans domain-containing protein n=1 Tax=Steinernema glaseri TaxID=37863 RepID=A0A1I7ZA75_9BILA
MEKKNGLEKQALHEDEQNEGEEKGLAKSLTLFNGVSIIVG